MTTTQFNDDKVKITKVTENPQSKFTWIFIPGGPGMDSSYFDTLINAIDLNENCWRIDFPGNGDYSVDENYDYDEWLELFFRLTKQFDNPIIVGHSAGGCYPLLFPELENVLKGLILMNTPPCLWLEEAAKFAQEHELPDLTNDMQEFTLNPNQTTFDKALLACTPYYFTKDSLEAGREFLSKYMFAYKPAVWWQRKAIEINFRAKWIPQEVNTLVICGDHDAMIPFNLYENFKAFHRPNIKITCIKNAGHAPWFEQPEEVKKLFHQYKNTFNN